MSSLRDRINAQRASLLGTASPAPIIPASLASAPTTTLSQIAKIRARHLTETQRIAALPEANYLHADAAAWTRRLARRPDHEMYFPNGDRVELREIQAQMLQAFEHVRVGGFFSVGTGHGKTLAAFLLGAVFEDIKRVILLAPSSTIINLEKERLRFRPYFNIPSDLVIESFERIQRATPEGQRDLIEQLVTDRNGDPAATLIVVDEAHRLKNMNSARGGRFMALISGMPEIRVCMLSGSLFDNSIKESAHLAWMALRECSPLPGEWGKDAHSGKAASRALSSWAACLDVKGEPDQNDWLEFLPIVRKAELALEFQESIGKKRTTVARRAFQARLRSCPGVVVSADSSLQGVALNIHGFCPDVPDNIQIALDEVDALGVDPDGNELADDMAIWRIQRQLSQGFFLVWDWPLGADGKPLVDAEWKLARSTWNKHVRMEIAYNRANGYDSEFLVYGKVQRDIKQFAVDPVEEAWVTFVGRSRKDMHEPADVVAERKAHKAWTEAGGNPAQFQRCLEAFLDRTKDSALHHAWVKWSGMHKHKPQPPTKAIWVDDFLVEAVIEWALKHDLEGFPTLIWYDFKEFGDELQRRGIPAYGAGTEPPLKAQTIALSIGTHSEGKNLPQWSRQMVVSPPTGGKRWQQMTARTFRPGQLAKQVDTWVCQHTDPFVDALHKARAAADFVYALNGMEQNLLLATYQGIAVRKLGSELFDADRMVDEISRLDDLDKGDDD